MEESTMTALPLPPPRPPDSPGFPPGPGAADLYAPDPDAGTLAVANAALRGGFVLLPRTLLHAPGLSRDAKLLYAVLLSYAWQAGSCFPGYERLQADLQCSVNSVTKWMQELERAGLVTRRKRGQGKTTRYTLHDPAAPPAPPAPPPGPESVGAAQTPKNRESHAAPVQTPKCCDSGLPKIAALGPQSLRPEYHSEERDSVGHHPAAVVRAGRLRPPGPVAPTSPPGPETAGAGDDDALELLVAQGVTRRIAQELAQTHSPEAIRQQLAWRPYRPVAKSAAGALVQAIRDAWPPPPAWLEAREHDAAIARQAETEAQRRAEDAARRREWAQKPPAERIAGRLQFWLLGQRRKGREPSPAEVAARRAELLAELAAADAEGDADGDSAGGRA
jgi:hypothetical protein